MARSASEPQKMEKRAGGQAVNPLHPKSLKKGGQGGGVEDLIVDGKESQGKLEFCKVGMWEYGNKRGIT